MVLLVFGRKYTADKGLIEKITQEKYDDLETKIVIVINEASTKAGGFHFDFNKLKDIITSSSRSIRKLFMDGFEVNNYSNYIMTTNNLQSVKIEGNGDAR